MEEIRFQIGYPCRMGIGHEAREIAFGGLNYFVDVPIKRAGTLRERSQGGLTLLGMAHLMSRFNSPGSVTGGRQVKSIQT